MQDVAEAQEEAMAKQCPVGAAVLVLLPVPGTRDQYRWTPGSVVSHGAFDGMFYHGPLDVRCGRNIYRGCSGLCVLPGDASEDLQQERLGLVLERMKKRGQE